MSQLILIQLERLDERMRDIQSMLSALDIEIDSPTRMAKVLGCSRQTVYRMMDRGELRAIETISGLLKKRAMMRKHHGSTQNRHESVNHSQNNSKPA